MIVYKGTFLNIKIALLVIWQLQELCALITSFGRPLWRHYHVKESSILIFSMMTLVLEMLCYLWNYNLQFEIGK